MSFKVMFARGDFVLGISVEPPDYASLTQSTAIFLIPCFPIIVTRRVKAFS
jgi:hypothetical protein